MFLFPVPYRADFETKPSQQPCLPWCEGMEVGIRCAETCERGRECKETGARRYDGQTRSNATKGVESACETGMHARRGDNSPSTVTDWV